MALNANVDLSGNRIFRKKQQMTEATNEPLKTFLWREHAVNSVNNM